MRRRACKFFILSIFSLSTFKVSRIQSIALNVNKFQNNSEGKIHRHLHHTINIIYEQVKRNKQIDIQKNFHYKNDFA